MRTVTAAARLSRRSSTDLFAIYTEDIARYPLLTREAEAVLGYRARAGDIEAQAQLVQHNLRFVITVAREYWKSNRQLMDLIQDGNLGLAKAARNFNPESGARFTQYARVWVHKEIQFGLGETAADVRVKRGRRQLVRRIERLQGEAVSASRPPLSVEELAAATGRSLEVIVDALKHPVKVVSLFEPVGDEPKRTLADTLSTATTLHDEEAADDAATIIAAAMRSARLTPRERSVVEAYYGLGQFRNTAERTLEEIGAHYGVSRERVRQIRDRAIEKLAAHLKLGDVRGAIQPMSGSSIDPLANATGCTMTACESVA